MKGIDYFHQHLGFKMEFEFNISSTPDASFCMCCKRPAEQWPTPQRCVVGESYGKKEIHCLPCHSLYHPSFKLLGHEGFRGSNPTALKLGMLKGCGALVTSNSSVLYAPKKYYQKFIATECSIFDEIVDLGGKNILIDVIKRKPAPSFLFIHNFGVKKSELVANLKVTRRDDAILVCSEEEFFELPLLFTEFQSLVGSMDKKSREEWAKLFRRSCTSHLKISDMTTLSELTSSVDGFNDTLLRLPVDPHLRLKMINLVGE